MLPQDASLQRDVPVIDQLTMFGRLHGWTSDVARDRGLSALNFVGLADVATRSAGALSHGMTKRVAVAQTLLGDPDVLLLDEPTAGLDPDNARAMRQLIRRLHGETRTVIISSHDLNEIQDLCDTVAILQHGRLVETAAMESLVHTGRLFRFRLPSALTPMISDALSQVPGVLKVTVEGDRDVSVHLDAEGVGDLDSMLGGIYGILGHHRLWPRRVEEGARLEARFLEITGADP
jgi:ABC-2 type transport system ATP-binding protein